ncbi:MAG: DUF3825 domain-containing protein [Coriobacteriia bacterium]|nr:DUF3825 domain-containing protein [Coriobacteriia bacterium]
MGDMHTGRIELDGSQRQVISHAAKSQKYQRALVPGELREMLSEDLLSFAAVPYWAQAKLSDLYGSEHNCMNQIAADWKEAFVQGALRLFDEATISFPSHVQLENGEAVELSISKSSREGGFPWVVSYVPDVSLLKLRSSAPNQERACAGYVAVLPFPPLGQKAIERVQNLKDYQSGPVPTELISDFEANGRKLSSFAGLPPQWAAQILDCAEQDLDVGSLLDRDWEVALSNRALRYYEGKVIFPISILRSDGATPIEVSLRPDRNPEHSDSLPWHVCYVDSYVRQRNRAGRALTDWAYLGNYNELLAKLSDMALDETWDFGTEGENRAYSILRSYLTNTFYRLQSEGKVLENREMGIAAFDTGLVDDTYEAIYACFSPSDFGLPWRFEAFCKAGSRMWGKKLVATFDPLPQRASYVGRKEDLLFDSSRTLQRDVDHILLDNIDRLPVAFLAEELRGSDLAMDALEKLDQAQDEDAKKRVYDSLREIVEDDARIKRRLINRLDDAIKLAQKRVEWNFRTAVPAFFPTGDSMSLLLPLDLTEDGQPDVALVVELMESGAYIGQTILTMKMAYNNARLICRPDSDWLNTSIQSCEEDE